MFLYDMESELVNHAIQMVIRKLNMGKYRLRKKLKECGFNVSFQNLNKWIVDMLHENPLVLYSMLSEETMSLNDICEAISEGSIIIITGSVGMGKTNLSLRLYETMKKFFPLSLYTNFSAQESCTINDSETLERVLLEPGEGRKMVIFDDLEFFASSHESPMGKVAKWFDKQQVFVRKHHAIFIYIVPIWEHILKSLRRYARFTIHKINHTTALLFGKQYPFPKLIVNISPTKLHYDTYQKATFYLSEKHET